ncbi:MAG: glycoside hydrolase family 2 TIM barrel-domain containing protein [Clostridia bacterium]
MLCTLTKWGEKLDKNNVLTEYPRPQMVRQSYYNLNGEWEYAITDGTTEPAVYDGKILVPFSPECELSGVSRMLLPEQTLWYRRTLPRFESGCRVLLHFGAADQIAVIYIDDVQVCSHTGGYTPFTADITGMCTKASVLTVKVKDYTDTSHHSRGKQKSKRGGIWYTPQSGIWQTVWAECVPQEYINYIRFTPLYDEAAVEVTVVAQQDLPCRMQADGREIEFMSNAAVCFPMPEFIAWSPEQPHLYDVNITMGDDNVQSYFGMRKFGVGKDDRGIWRLLLNGRPYFHNGVLDQGYWPDGMYTAPSDEALVYDIQLMKDMGFNMLRKHVKLESMRFYYHCDKLGMLVWQDMMCGGGEYKPYVVMSPLITGVHFKDNNYARFGREDETGRVQYYNELGELVDALYNAPCVAMWVPFNEGWGQFDAAAAVRFILQRDVSRTIDHASGWHDQHIGKIKSRHVYFKPFHMRRDKKRAVVLSEFGGYGRRIDGHSFSEKDFGYKRTKSEADLFAAISVLYDDQVREGKRKGLAAAVYTQLSDVEDELNGLVSCDRKVLKLSVLAVRDIMNGLGGAGNMAPAKPKRVRPLFARGDK